MIRLCCRLGLILGLYVAAYNQSSPNVNRQPTLKSVCPAISLRISKNAGRYNNDQHTAVIFLDGEVCVDFIVSSLPTPLTALWR